MSFQHKHTPHDKGKKRKIRLQFLFVALVLTVLSGPARGETIRASYLYTLSDFYGPVPCNWVSLTDDAGRFETYVADVADRSVRVFNSSGMEVYRFGDDGTSGTVSAVAVSPQGDIYILSRKADHSAITRCNFRGEPQGKVELKGLPPEFARDFLPDTILYRQGNLYLVDRNAMKVAVTGLNGAFKSGDDLGALLGFDEKKRRDSGISGFSVDRKGDYLFTIPVFFSAYVVSPDKKVRIFGERGGTPGKFNVVGGIAADDRGNIYVADTLRCVVMVFDENLKFRTEFGYRGLGPGNLIAPMDLAVNNDMVYVSQSRARGVSVYRIFTD